MTDSVSFAVGATLDAGAVVGHLEYWHWRFTVLGASEKAVKLGVPGSSKFLWLPKAAFTNTTKDGDVRQWVVSKIRSSYIAIESLYDTRYIGK